jgi:hypothetical protein
MKGRSVSSTLAERRKQRAAVTPSKASVRHVKFTSEEMAYDPSPEETADWIPVGRGPEAIFAKPSDHKAKMVKLDPDVAEIFKDSEAVNLALRKLIEAVPEMTKRKKSA